MSGIFRVSPFDLDVTLPRIAAASQCAGSMAPQLPSELWARVFDHVPASDDLRRCMLLNSEIGAEAERAMYMQLAFVHVVPLLRLRLALKRSDSTRRDRRLRAVRSLAVRLKNIGLGYSYFPNTYGSLHYLCRKAILREVANLVAACPALAHLELDLPMLPGARQPLDVARLLPAPFALSSLACTLPLTPDLLRFLSAHAPSLRRLDLVPPTAPPDDALAALPPFPRLQQLGTFEELAGMCPTLSMLRVQCRNRPSVEGVARTLARIRGAQLEVLRIDAPFSHAVVLAVADALPALKGLSVDCDSPPNYTGNVPWSAEQWTEAFRKFTRLANFRLRYTGGGGAAHGIRRVWAQHKRAALASWHAACPTLRSIAFPGEKGYWVLSARTGAWREPIQ